MKTTKRRTRCRARKPSRARRQSKAVKVEPEIVRPRVGTLGRTKMLLLAALRVWELKNGYRPEPHFELSAWTREGIEPPQQVPDEQTDPDTRELACGTDAEARGGNVNLVRGL